MGARRRADFARLPHAALRRVAARLGDGDWLAFGQACTRWRRVALASAATRRRRAARWPRWDEEPPPRGALAVGPGRDDLRYDLARGREPWPVFCVDDAAPSPAAVAKKLRAGALRSPAAFRYKARCSGPPLPGDPERRPQVQVVWEGAKRGYGLRTLTAVPEGQLVGEYVGERRKGATGTRDGAYLVDEQPALGGWSIDAERVGCATRFVQLAPAGAATLRAVVVASRRGRRPPRLAFVAARDIQPYEELTWTYRIAPERPSIV